jgi:hypothetical protein
MESLKLVLLYVHFIRKGCQWNLSSWSFYMFISYTEGVSRISQVDPLDYILEAEGVSDSSESSGCHYLASGCCDG